MGRRRNRRFFKKIRRKKFKFRIDLQKLAAIGIWIFKIGVACLLAFVCVWYFGQQVSTVGDSMKPVLGNGDVVLVNRIIYNATTPKRGDIIVFKPKGSIIIRSVSSVCRGRRWRLWKTEFISTERSWRKGT